MKYAGYMAREKDSALRLAAMEELSLPADLPYRISGDDLLEAREKLDRIRPASLGQAAGSRGSRPVTCRTWWLSYPEAVNRSDASVSRETLRGTRRNCLNPPSDPLSSSMTGFAVEAAPAVPGAFRVHRLLSSGIGSDPQLGQLWVLFILLPSRNPVRQLATSSSNVPIQGVVPEGSWPIHLRLGSHIRGLPTAYVVLPFRYPIS